MLYSVFSILSKTQGSLPRQHILFRLWEMWQRVFLSIYGQSGLWKQAKVIWILRIMNANKGFPGFIAIAFVWWCYFTAKDCRLCWFWLYKYVYRLYICNFFCLNKTITLTKRMQTIFKATLFNLRVLHRRFHFNTPSNLKADLLQLKLPFDHTLHPFSVASDQYSCVLCLYIFCRWVNATE